MKFLNANGLIGTAFFALSAVIAVPAFAKEPIKLNWQINHYPEKYFVETAAKMNEILKTSTAGKKLEIVPILPKDNSWNVERLAHATKLGVRNGDYHLAQAYTFTLTEFDERLKVYDLPYLFEGHEHFERVVESSTGEKTLARLRDFGYEPLAVTYSGGLVAIPARKALRRPADFNGVLYKAWEHNVNYETHRVLKSKLANAFEIIAGAYKTKEFSVLHGFKTKKQDAADCEVAELGQLENEPGLVFNLLNHRMLATVLLMHKPTFDSLPAETRKALKKAAVEAARWERHEIIRAEGEIVARLKSQGKQVVELSESELSEMKKAVRPVHQYFEPVIGKDLMEEIRGLGKSKKLVTIER